MDTELTQMAKFIADELNRAKKRIKKGKDDVQKFVDQLPKELQEIGKEAAKNIQVKFKGLETGC